MAIPLFFGTKARSAAWPIAGTMLSQAMVNSDPFTGMGRRRPLASGSPSSIRDALDTRDLPVFAERYGPARTRNSILIPSSRASSISSGAAGISVAGPAVMDEYTSFDPVPDCRSDRVHRDVPAADDGHAVARKTSRPG